MRVGFRTGLVLDQNRLHWDGTAPRPISWAAWYPAGEEAIETDMIVGGPGDTWFDIGPSQREAPLHALGRPFPVALISHGTGGAAWEMGWLGRRLAQRGFIALAANHHGNTAVEPYRAEGFLCWWERARDLSVLLDHMQQDDAFGPCLDRDRVFVVGFSLGGHTAMALLGAVTEMDRFEAWMKDAGLSRGPREFPDLPDRLPGLMATSAVFRSSWTRQSQSYRDGRVRAGLLMAPAPPVRAFTEASLSCVAVPIHIMTGGSDAEAPAAIGAIWLRERLPCCTLDIVDADAGHFVFLPEATEAGRREAPDLCQDAPGVHRGLIHEAVAIAAERLRCAVGDGGGVTTLPLTGTAH